MGPREPSPDGGAGIKLIELENRQGDLERRLVQFESSILTKLATSEAKLTVPSREGSRGPDDRRELSELRRDVDTLRKELDAVCTAPEGSVGPARTGASGGEELAATVAELRSRLDVLDGSWQGGAEALVALHRRVEELAAANGRAEQESLSRLDTLRGEIVALVPTLEKALAQRSGDADQVKELRTLFEGVRLRLDKLLEETPSPQEMSLKFSRIETRLGRIDALAAEVESLKARSADASDVEAVARVVQELRPITERLGRMEEALNKRLEEVLAVQIQVRDLKERLADKELTEIKEHVVALDDSLADLKDGVSGLGE